VEDFHHATEVVSELVLKNCGAEVQHEASCPSLQHHLKWRGSDMLCVSDIWVTPENHYPGSTNTKTVKHHSTKKLKIWFLTAQRNKNTKKMSKNIKKECV